MSKNTKIIKRAFNAGEISNRAKWRNDTEKHAYSCEKLENFYVSPLGAISRREGTRLLNVLDVKDEAIDAQNVRIIPFEYNRDFSRILMFREKERLNTVSFITDEFEFTKNWSLCFKIPEDFIVSKRVPLIEHGDMLIEIDENNAIYFTNTKMYQDNDLTATVSDVKLEGNVGDSIIITFQDGEPYGDFSLLNFYRGDAQNITNLYPDGYSNVKIKADAIRRSKLTFYSHKYGDIWGLKICDFVIDDKNDIFSLSDYASGGQIKTLSESKEGTKESPLIPFGLEMTVNDIDNESGAGSILDMYDALPRLENLPVGATANITWNCSHEFKITKENVSMSAELNGFRVEQRDGTGVYDSKEFYKFNDFSYTDTVRWGVDRINLELIGTYGWAELTEGGQGSFNISLELYGTFTISASGSDIFERLDGQWYRPLDAELNVFDINGTLIKRDINVPFYAEFIKDFQYKQAGGWLYIAHPKFAPKKLSVGDGSLKWEEAVSIPPTVDDKIEDLSFGSESNNPSGLFFKGDVGTVKANRAFFNEDSIGRVFKVDYEDFVLGKYKWGNIEIPSIFTNEYTYSTDWFPAQGKTKVVPQGGVWEGVLILEESTNGGKTWNEIGRTTSVLGSDNTSFEREIYDPQSIVRARLKESRPVYSNDVHKYADEDLGIKFNIQRNSTISVWFEIIAIYNANEAKVRYLNPVRQNWGSKAVYNGCWNSVFGYPNALEIHEERLVFAGTKNQPTTIWLSQTNNWDNFRSVSNLDTDPLSYTLASDSGEPIYWLASREDLMIGLGNSEWSLGSRESGKALTSSVVQASNQSEDGVEFVMPTRAGGMVVFVRRGGLELASISYDFAADSYNAISLTTMNPELLSSGVVNIFNQLSPNNKIYVVCKNGNLAVFTYDKENNVAAWGRFTFGDGVISACALSTGKYKSIFVIAKRNGVLCLERLDPNELGTNNWLDCVPINADINIPTGLETSIPYESVVKTTPVFLEGNIRLSGIKLYLINSFGGKFRLEGIDEAGDDIKGQWQNILPKENELWNKTPRDYRFYADIDCGYLEEGAITVSTNETAPFELTAIAVKAQEY